MAVATASLIVGWLVAAAPVQLVVGLIPRWPVGGRRTSLAARRPNDVRAATANVSTDSGSRTAIVALHGRAQSRRLWDGPDFLAPRLLQAIVTDAAVPGRGVAAALSLGGALSRAGFALTGGRVVAEDLAARAATLGSTGLVAPLHCRTRWLDDCVKTFLAERRQRDGDGDGPGGNLIVLGAGYDTRCHRFRKELARAGVRGYEVDAPGTQATKRRALRRAGVVRADDGVAYCGCDFATEDWLDALARRGGSFDPALPTLVLWEGVTMYLPEEAVARTLATASGAAETHGGDWRVAFDYLSAEWAMSAPWRRVMGLAGEPFQFAVAGSDEEETRRKIEDLVTSCGLTVLEHYSNGRDIDERYLPPQGALRLSAFGNYGGFVVARTP